MTDAEKLAVLKSNLQMITSSNDELLAFLLRQGGAALATEGVTDDGSVMYEACVIDYAAYLCAQRDGDAALLAVGDQQSPDVAEDQGGSGMTFDDGIIQICSVVNGADPGDKPVRMLSPVESFHFGYDNLGITRYYTALQAHQQIEAVVNIPGWNRIAVESVAVLEDGTQYAVRMVQPQTDEDGLRITKLSLERISQSYDFVT